MRPVSLVLIINNGRLLVGLGRDSHEGFDFCRPLGGCIEFGETSLCAIKREIKEEIGATLQNEKLLTVIENIFEYNGQKCHEIVFLYSGEILEEDLCNAERLPILDKESKYAEWISISDIKEGKIRILPKECLDFI